MRDIEFSGFNVKNDKWLYGYYLRNRGAYFVCPDEFANGKTWDDYEAVPESVGEFTGFTDMDGRRIYEGDMFTLGKWFDLKVVFESNGIFLKRTNGDKNWRLPLDEKFCKAYRIIGNVFEKEGKGYAHG